MRLAGLFRMIPVPDGPAIPFRDVPASALSAAPVLLSPVLFQHLQYPYHLQFLADGMYTAMAEGTVFVQLQERILFLIGATV